MNKEIFWKQTKQDIMGFKSLDKLENSVTEKNNTSNIFLIVFPPLVKLSLKIRYLNWYLREVTFFSQVPCAPKSHDYGLVIKSPDFEEVSFIEQGITQSLQKCCKVGETKAPWLQNYFIHSASLILIKWLPSSGPVACLSSQILHYKKLFMSLLAVQPLPHYWLLN